MFSVGWLDLDTEIRWKALSFWRSLMKSWWTFNLKDLAYPTKRRPYSRPRTCWRFYISFLLHKRLDREMSGYRCSICYLNSEIRRNTKDGRIICTWLCKVIPMEESCYLFIIFWMRHYSQIKQLKYSLFFPKTNSSFSTAYSRFD